ncbi:MAG: SDR family oxidoreductase [Planctomycetaceae bacterium]|nr:SDR family oxidoreductase [Planctomycetaceae bacterium]
MTSSPRTVVITGGGGGIGCATALRFAASGDRVFVCDLRFTDDVHAELTDAGVHCGTLDVTDVTALTEFVNHARNTTGCLDVLVNNAGVGLVKQAPDVSEREWDTVLDTNLKAAFFGCGAAIRHMQTQERGGAIVNLASNAGLMPRSHDPVYSISKQALVGLTKSLALCHSKDRIRVNCICPGPVSGTQLIQENFETGADPDAVVRQLISASPLARSWGRMMTPQEIAASVYFLCSEEACMVTGTAIAIDGGKSLGVPPAAD